MPFDGTRYRTGYSLGVGGVVLHGDKVLLVRAALGSNAGDWAIPGGFVEHGETIDVAIQREVREEANVGAEIVGLIALRNRVTEGENSAYCVFLLQATSAEAHPDNFEVDGAQYVALDGVLALPRLGVLSKLILAEVLARRTSLLTLHPHPDYLTSEYVLFL